jgi:vancomycin resistance protein YoaR
MSFVSVPKPQRTSSPLFLQIVATLMGGLVLFLAGLGLVSGGYQLLFTGRIFPGITMAGVDLSSLTPEQASTILNQHLTYPNNGQIVFQDGNHVWTATPRQLGMVFDVGTSVQRAYGLGRRGGPFASLSSQINAWQGGLNLPPVIIIDERVTHSYLQNIASQIDRPVVEANLQLNGTSVAYTPGQTGRFLNVDETLKSLLKQLESFKDGEVPLIITEQVPDILDASQQAQSLQNALSQPLTLTITDKQAGDPGPWTITPEQLAGILSVDRVKTASNWQYQISFDPKSLEQFLGQIAPLVNQDAHNARFYFDDNSRQLVLVTPAVTGRTLDVAATRDEIAQKVLQGEHDLPLVLTLAKPAVPTDATAASLGITGLVSSYTSYFRYSSSARMQNIQTAAAQFYGLLIPPNTTFSMGDAIGNISMENGYAEALIIYNGQTITGVGGGVCQVSTTLFRAAYYGGYPIVERHAHAYRVLYYEQTATGYDTSLAGLDATVYFPLVDFKFKNDRPYWLLMETYFNPDTQSLTWKFYSGDDGRTVDVQNLGLQKVVPAPDPLLVENPDLPPGTCKQVDYQAAGADITVVRSVTLNGQRLNLDGDTIRTNYEPWQAVYQFGSGTNNPQSLIDQGMCSH